MCDINSIPIVYMWVNADDPKYRLRHNITTTNARNRDNNELLYSIRSLEKCMPWWNGTLYLVTDKQVPLWIEASHPRLKIVDHTDIIPKEYLPTGVSFTIEWFLHLIPGIDDYFITLNDDFMFLKSCEPSSFFNTSGLPIMPLNNNVINIYEDINAKPNKMWHYNVVNSLKTLEKKIGYTFPTKYFIQHAPRIFSKKVLCDLHILLEKEIKNSISGKHRIMGTLDTIYVVVYYMAYKLNQDVVPNSHIEYFLNINNDTKLSAQYNIINKSASTYLCLNDDNFTNQMKKYEIITLCNRLFPTPSSFEKETPQKSIEEKAKEIELKTAELKANAKADADAKV